MLTFCPTLKFSLIFAVCWFLFKLNFSQKIGNTIRVSNSFNPYQARRPYLGPGCLQKYQQTTLAGKGLYIFTIFNMLIAFASSDRFILDRNVKIRGYGEITNEIKWYKRLVQYILTLEYFCTLFFSFVFFSFKSTFSKNSFKNATSVKQFGSISTRRFVVPDLGANSMRY